MKEKEKIKDIRQGDFLAFKSSDDKYKVLFCTSVYKQRSPHHFYMAATNCSTDNKPTAQDILESEFFGIGNRNCDYFKYEEDEIEKFWSYHPEIKPCFLGSYGIFIQRKEFMQIRENLEFISNVAIVNNLDKHGNGSVYLGNMASINNFFTNDLANLMKERGQKPFKIKALLK